MKSLSGDGRQVEAKVVTAEEALRYAMSLPVATTVSGIDSMRVLRQNLKVADGFEPMSPRQMEALRKRVREEAADGRFELYKTTAMHEGPVGRQAARVPETRRNCPRRRGHEGLANRLRAFVARPLHQEVLEAHAGVRSLPGLRDDEIERQRRPS